MTPDILKNICEYREQYLDVFKRRVHRKLFHAQKYKDKQSCDEPVSYTHLTLPTKA